MTWLIFFHPHHVSCFRVLFILRIIEYWVAEFWANENNEKSELIFVKCACLASKLCLKCQPKLKLMLTFKTVEQEFVSKNLCWNWSVGENVILTDIANYAITNARIVCDEFTSNWCDAAPLHASLRWYLAKENRGDKCSWYSNATRRRLDIIYSTNRRISNSVCKPMSCKCNMNLFPFRCDFLVVFVCVASFRTNSVTTGNSYPFVTVVDRIRYKNFNSILPVCVEKLPICGYHYMLQTMRIRVPSLSIGRW